MHTHMMKTLSVVGFENLYSINHNANKSPDTGYHLNIVILYIGILVVAYITELYFSLEVKVIYLLIFT